MLFFLLYLAGKMEGLLHNHFFFFCQFYRQAIHRCAFLHTTVFTWSIKAEDEERFKLILKPVLLICPLIALLMPGCRSMKLIVGTLK
jgi:hypothetical protein